MRTIQGFTTTLIIGLILVACGGPGAGPTTGPPATPGEVTLSQQDGYVSVSWSHDGAGVTGFRVTRSDAAATTSGTAARASDEAVFELGPQARSIHDTTVQVGRSYAYEVTALGTGDNASAAARPAAPVTVEAGFTLVTGTYAASFVDGPTSALGMFFYLPDDQPFDTQPSVTITGPAGWNDDEPWVSAPPVAWVRNGFVWTVAGFAPAVVGTYSAELSVDGDTYTSSSDLTSLDMVDLVNGVALEEAEREFVRVSFDPHPTAVSFVATVYEGVDANAANVGFSPSLASPIQVDDLDLVPGEHYVVVTAYPFDRTASGRLVPPARFDVGVGITPIFVIEPVAISCDDPSNEPIADVALSAAIREELGIASGPNCAQVASLASVHADGRGVRWLQGLEHAVALENLQLDNNAITDIGPLAGLPALRWLWLGGNTIEDAAVVATLPDLLGLSLWLNPITTFAPLAGLTELTDLFIGSTQARDVQHLAGLTSLRRVHLYDTGITDLAFVAGMTQLEELMLGGGNDISDASVLAGLTALTDLDLNYSQLTDASFLGSLPNLRVLHIGGNPLSDTSPITALTGLEELNVERLDLESLAFLSGSPDLRGLWAGGNDVSDVTVLSSLASLRHVWLWGNPIADPAPVYGLSGLISLDIGGTGIDDLSFLGASPELENLSAWGNGVSDISVTQGLEKLSHAGLSGNALTSLAPLIANPGIGEGTRVEVEWNCLDLTTGSADRSELDQLLDRGVDLVFEPQRDDC